MCRLCLTGFCACIPTSEHHLLPPMETRQVYKIWCFTFYVNVLLLGRFTDLEDIFMHQDDCLKGCPTFVGQLMECFLFAPVLLQQGVTYYRWGAFEARAEVEGDVRARLGAAAARQVNLKPADRVHTDNRSFTSCGKVQGVSALD